MSIDSIISVTTRVNNAGLSLEPIGLPACMTYTSLFPQRKRVVGKLSDVVAIGYDKGSAEYRFANAAFSQVPKPTKICFIRGTLAPTIEYLIGANEVHDGITYAIQVGGDGVKDTVCSYVATTGTTAAKINNALFTALNAVASKNYLAAYAPLTLADLTFTVDASTDVVTTGSAHGLTVGGVTGPYQVSNSGGGLPAPLATVTNYWFTATGASTGKLSTSLALALAGTYINITTAGTGTQTISDTADTVNYNVPFSVTASAAGEYFVIDFDDSSLIQSTLVHDDPGVTTDLDAIVAVDKNWYVFETPGASKEMILSAAAWAEAQSFKFYSAITSDTEVENGANVGDDLDGDVGSNFTAFGYKRSHLFYRRKVGQFTSAGLFGRVASLKPGSWDAAFMTIAGSTSDSFTTQQEQNLDDKRTTRYKSEAGNDIIWEGKIGSLEYLWLDVTWALDFAIDLIQKSAFSLLKARANAGTKLAMLDVDIIAMEKKIKSAVDLMTDAKYTIVSPGTPGSTDDPVPTVTFPRVKDISSDDRSKKALPDGQVFFRLTTSIHTVDIDLTVTF